jgi:hypothetical protein
LPLAEGVRKIFGLTSGVHDPIGFIEGIERMRGPGLALTPTAVAGMDNQWRSDQTISDLPARASAFHVRLRGGVVQQYRSISVEKQLR